MLRLAIVLIASLLVSGCSTLGFSKAEETCSPNSVPMCIEVTKGQEAIALDLETMLKRQEGFESKPYKDSTTVSIGYGRNLLKRGITQEEALILLRNDIQYFDTALAKQHPVYNDLSYPRQHALISLAFSVGMYGIGQFDLMWEAIERKDYKQAALEIIMSKYCSQVGDRCIELSEMMRTSQYATEKG